jgi:hypothetical protein
VWLQLFKLGAACNTKTGFLPSLYDGITCTTDKQGGTQIEIQTFADILKVIANVARILIAMSGALAVIFIIVAGIWYITSAGDPGRIKRAKDIIINSIVGLIIIMTAYGVVTFIAKGF